MTEPAIDESEFYDGPDPSKVHQLFRAPIEEVRPRPDDPDPPPMPGPKPKENKRDHYLAAINVAMDVLSLRLVLLIAVLAEAAMFGYSVFYPDLIRLSAAAAFAILVGGPLVYFYAGTK